VQLAKKLPLLMRGLALEGAATRDVKPAPSVGGPGGMAVASAAPGDDAAGEAAGAGHPTGQPLPSLRCHCMPQPAAPGLRALPAPGLRAGDADVAEFDAQMLGSIAQAGETGGDERDVPPCYKAQHAARRSLQYQLHLSLLEAEGTFSQGSPAGLVALEPRAAQPPRTQG